MSVVVLIGLTSLGAYLAGTRAFGLPRPALAAAVRATLEAVGMAAVFLVANLGLAVLAIGAVRAGTGHFISVYTVDDLGVAGASLLQGFLFRWWWSRR